MATTDRIRAQAGRRTINLLRTVGVDVREARLGLGLSQAAVARAAGTSHAQISRIERSAHRRASLADLVAICAIVGLDLSVRAYPGGSPIRDVAHVELLERLRRRLGPGLRWQTEVPLGLSGDQRAWDATISSSEQRLAVEAEVRLRDVQAVIRRINLKIQDGGMERTLLLVRESRINRDALRLAAPHVASVLPLQSRPILRALAEGRLPIASGIVVL